MGRLDTFREWVSKSLFEEETLSHGDRRIIWNRGTSNCRGLKVRINLDIQVLER